MVTNHMEARGQVEVIQSSFDLRRKHRGAIWYSLVLISQLVGYQTCSFVQFTPLSRILWHSFCIKKLRAGMEQSSRGNCLKDIWDHVLHNNLISFDVNYQKKRFISSGANPACMPSIPKWKNRGKVPILHSSPEFEVKEWGRLMQNTHCEGLFLAMQ